MGITRIAVKRPISALMVLLAILVFGIGSLFGFSMEQAALAGDQIYTDVLGANCAGAKSILVTPIHLHNIWLRLRHVAEKPFIAMGKRNRV